MDSSQDVLSRAAACIRNASSMAVFTGAGISVESGIPSFRGAGGLWERYDPRNLDLSYFMAHPERAWPVIKEIFYEGYGRCTPNDAHLVLADWEAQGIVKGVVTMNIDELHHKAGQRMVHEYHGCIRSLTPVPGSRAESMAVTEELIAAEVPRSADGRLLKPDFTFFGEGIDPDVAYAAERLAREADVFLVIGTTGEVYPAASLPLIASRAGAGVIEINPEPSAYTHTVTDIFIRMPASQAMRALQAALAESEGER